jgi:hypothetical protein
VCKDHPKPGIAQNPQQLANPQHTKANEKTIGKNKVATKQKDGIEEQYYKDYMENKPTRIEKLPPGPKKETK